MTGLKRSDSIQISELTCRKDAKLTEITSLQNILSPIRRAPLEILSEIFELSCLPKDGVFRAACKVMRHSLILTAVCAAWRKAAHSTPRIWSTICLVINDNNKGLEKDWVVDWIIRSQSFPLDLYLDFRAVDDDLAHRTLEHILHSCERIRLFDLVGYAQTFLPLYRLPCSSLPLLEEVSLDLEYNNNDDDSFPTFSRLLPNTKVFLGSPKLQHVKIWEPWFSSSMLEVLTIPAGQLTSLQITFLSYPDYDLSQSVYVDVLSSCQNLNDLQFIHEDFQEPCIGFSSKLSITLPLLRSLHVSCMKFAGDGASNLLHCLTAPLLEDLTLCWAGQDLHNLSIDVTSFQNRSATARLLSLTVEFRFAPARELFAENLVAILGFFPTINSLSLRTSYVLSLDIDITHYSEPWFTPNQVTSFLLNSQNSISQSNILRT
ncbi:hypothetical protein BT96DRAFT_917705 [Gymnopus androsaceus JB14]|uniref:Uncharacterized protein n=1 Tax=Gymnopus androsaceus JB14 TaxID=1447944 RepID=A0A6A4HZC5_9AGAR|nr:hypothetical protein BT96DRAFT_917705 [Gymnopus androsaceus JB14]